MSAKSYPHAVARRGTNMSMISVEAAMSGPSLNAKNAIRSSPHQQTEQYKCQHEESELKLQARE